MKTTEKTLRMAVGAPKAFKEACEQAGIPPTARQLRKWNEGYGTAYRTHNNLPIQPVKKAG